MNRLKWFVIGFISIIILALSSIWFKRQSVESILLDKLVKKFSPSLPFTIESYELSKNLNALSLHLNFQGQTALLNGPLHWNWVKKDGIVLRYEPSVQIEGATPFNLLLTAQTEREWVHLDKLSLQISPIDFQWKKYGIDSKKFSLNAVYDAQILKTEIGLGSLAWTDAHHADRAVNLTDFNLSTTASGFDQDLSLQSNLTAKELETLWGKLYLDLPLSHFPIHFDVENERNLTLTIGNKIAEVSAKLDDKLAQFHHAEVRFHLTLNSLSGFVPWISKNLVSFEPALETLSDYSIKKGVLSATGDGQFNRDQKDFTLESLESRAKSLSFNAPSKHLSALKMNAEINYSRKRKTQSAHLSSEQFNFKHFTAKLLPTEISWNEKGFEVLNLPLQIKNIPLSFGKISATFAPAFDLETSVVLKNTNFTPIGSGFCLPVDKIPPITLTANFTNLKISKSEIEPTGKVEAKLFGGKIELNEFGMYDLDTEVPETDFDLDWSGIDLQKSSNWGNFGEIEGTLEGYSHDVVMQGSLPTQFHFLIDVAPKEKSSRVDFSPEAMKNVVKIFTGADLDQQIPGIAGWAMFGWPSHLLGGYDVYYAGLKLTADDGHIIVETIDKPGIVESERKHFVLYGPRFKMPLQSSTYPLVVDAASMSNFVHQLVTQLQLIRLKKEASQNETEPEATCEPPQI
jgi:hypothetical protein